MSNKELFNQLDIENKNQKQANETKHTDIYIVHTHSIGICKNKNKTISALACRYQDVSINIYK